MKKSFILAVLVLGSAIIFYGCTQYAGREVKPVNHAEPYSKGTEPKMASGTLVSFEIETPFVSLATL